MRLEAIALTLAFTLLFVGAGGILPESLYSGIFTVSLAAILSLLLRRTKFRQRLNPHMVTALLLFASWLITYLLPLNSLPDFLVSTQAEEILKTSRSLTEHFNTDAQAGDFFSLSFNRYGTINYLLLWCLFFTTVFLASRLNLQEKRYFLLVIFICGNITAGAIFISHYLISTEGLVWWIFDVNARDSFGPFVNPNHTAIFLNFSLIIGIIQTLELLKRKKRQTILFATASCLILIAIILCQSRGGLIISLMSLIIILLIQSKKDKKGQIIATAIACSGLLIAVHFIPQELDQTIHDAGFSPDSRIQLFKASLQTSADFPAGVGPGAFRFITPSYVPPGTLGSSTPHHSENFYLQILVEVGIPGACLLTMLFFGWLKESLRYTQVHSQRIKTWSYIAVTVIAVHGLYDYAFQLPLYAFTCAIPLGFLLAPTHKRKEYDQEKSTTFAIRFLMTTTTFLLCGTIALKYRSSLRYADRFSAQKINSFETDMRKLYRIPAAWFLHNSIAQKLTDKNEILNNENRQILTLAEQNAKTAAVLRPARASLWLKLADIRIKLNKNNFKKPLIIYLGLLPQKQQDQKLKQLTQKGFLYDSEISEIKNFRLNFSKKSKHYWQSI